MLLRYFSDLHLDHDARVKSRLPAWQLWTPPELATDAGTVLVLAGDLWVGTRPIQHGSDRWLAALADRFKAIVVVLGNHDYYGDNLSTLRAKWRRLLGDQALHNVHLLDVLDQGMGSVAIDGVTFVGTTLWTDMGGSAAIYNAVSFDTQLGMNGRPLWADRAFIRAGADYRRFSGTTWLQQHAQAKHQLREVFQQSRPPTVLVTHHAPCLLSRRDTPDDVFYCSDISDLILDHPQVKLCIHGHTHDSHAYQMGDVSVRCNPRGYLSDPNEDFDERGLFEIA